MDLTLLAETRGEENSFQTSAINYTPAWQRARCSIGLPAQHNFSLKSPKSAFPCLCVEKTVLKRSCPHDCVCDRPSDRADPETNSLPSFAPSVSSLTTAACLFFLQGHCTLLGGGGAERHLITEEFWEENCPLLRIRQVNKCGSARESCIAQGTRHTRLKEGGGGQGDVSVHVGRAWLGLGLELGHARH